MLGHELNIALITVHSISIDLLIVLIRKGKLVSSLITVACT